MNIILWILQIFLALHTLMGAVWKILNSWQTEPSLKAIPHGVWLSLIVMELICGLCLILPAIQKQLGVMAPIAATCIVAEMLFFSGAFLYSGSSVRPYHLLACGSPYKRAYRLWPVWDKTSLNI